MTPRKLMALGATVLALGGGGAAYAATSGGSTSSTTTTSTTTTPAPSAGTHTCPNM